MNRRWRILSLAMIVVLGTLVPSAAAQTAATRAAEGQWVGFVGFRGTTAQTDQSFRGGFEFLSSGGAVEGTFQWGGGVTQIGGVISGADTMPRFDLTTVVSNGVDIPDVTGGGEIQFTAVTCERLEGTGVNIDVEMMGRANISEIVWWAVRGDASSDSAAFFEAFDSLQIEVGELVESLESGAIIVGGVVGRLEPLLLQAETLAAGLSRAESCDVEFYRSIIASEVERLFDYLLANPDVGPIALAQILLTAARVGLIGSGSEAGSNEPDLAAQALVEERIAVAIENADSFALTYLGAIAEDLGWDDLAADAQFAIEAMGE